MAKLIMSNELNRMVWALLPLKEFADAKQRLSGVLAAHERSRLFRCMVEDVLDVLHNHPAIEQIVIVSDDPGAQILADRYGVVCWSESSLHVSGLNPVVNSAAKKLQLQGVDNLLVVHGDLPLLCPNELQQLIDQHFQGALPTISIVPDTLNQGSNCLLATPPTAITFNYGEGSFEKHCKLACSSNANVNVVNLPSIALDIDKPIDLEVLLIKPSQKRSFQYLHDSSFARRFWGQEDWSVTFQEASPSNGAC